MEKRQALRRLAELRRLRTERCYRNGTNEEFIELLASYKEGDSFRTTPEREAIRNKAEEAGIRDIVLKQWTEWESRGRCCTCGEPVDSSESQCPECIEARWLFILLSKDLL